MFTTIDEAVAHAHAADCTVYRLGRRVVAFAVADHADALILQGREGEYVWRAMRPVAVAEPANTDVAMFDVDGLPV